MSREPDAAAGRIPLRLRRLARADLAFADKVRELAGWNQTLEDWERFLVMEPEGCFLAEWDGAPAGTATTTVYNSELAWIGMVLVHPDYRRRGIGRALLQRCIEYLHHRGVRCVKLDATPAGKLVYDGLGFCSEWTLMRWVGRAPTDLTEPGVRPWKPEDSEPAQELDKGAFGASRGALLRALARNSASGLTALSETGEVRGFGFTRAGSKALYLGPVVADSPAAGLKVVRALLIRHAGQLVFWDIPDPNGAAVALAQTLGFSIQRTLIRMFLGTNSTPGDPCRQFALAGPEVG